ncbi:MAG: hypothetical protein ACT4NL_02305 [Pseudomarimonas sp.]
MRGNSDSSAVQSVYIHLGNQLIASRKTDYDNLTQITYHHTDMLGSPVVESNAQGIPQSPTYQNVDTHDPRDDRRTVKRS